jgi:hypothetical protein
MNTCLSGVGEASEGFSQIRMNYGEKRHPMANFGSHRHSASLKFAPVQ